MTMEVGDQRFERARAAFFAAHEEDTRRVEEGGTEVPWSVLYHRRMAVWLEKLDAQASEPLRLAALCQHIRRWRRPREEYPEGKLGYKKWRSELAEFHAEQAAAILKASGYGEETIARVGDLLIKKNLKGDPETQTLEDVICLVFLENEFASFAEKHDPEKIAVILRKTWNKMSPRGREEALRLAPSLPPGLVALVERAIE